MLKFVAKLFRGLINVFLWLTLFGCIIGGFITGGKSFGGRFFSFPYAVLGLLIGSFIGLISIILSGGLIANFLNLVDDINVIKHHLLKSGNTSAGLNVNNNPPINQTVINTSDGWVCKKCSSTNKNDSLFCSNCGERK